jgi:hypothetical protein
MSAAKAVGTDINKILAAYKQVIARIRKFKKLVLSSVNKSWLPGENARVAGGSFGYYVRPGRVKLSLV